MTTKEMIEVMQAYEDGKTIEYRYKKFEFCALDFTWTVQESPSWDWKNCEYRIKPNKRVENLQFGKYYNCHFINPTLDGKYNNKQFYVFCYRSIKEPRIYTNDGYLEDQDPRLYLTDEDYRNDKYYYFDKSCFDIIEEVNCKNNNI